MPNYLYNDVSLPKLPEYNTSIYLHACINESSLISGVYILYLCSAPFYFSETEGNVRTVAGSSLSTSKYNSTTNKWEPLENRDSIAGNMGINPFWCNVDILKEDGTVYLAATEPTTTWSDLKSWLIGFILGLAGKPLPFSTKN